MACNLLCAVALGIAVSTTASGQVRATAPHERAESRTLVGVRNEFLYAGSQALVARQYEEGIRLTKLGLELATAPRDRASALSNLCAGYAAKNEPDVAIDYCTESLAINDSNWRAYSNRAFAYYLKRRFDEADRDLDRALQLNPDARQMPEIRGMMNERRLRGRVTIEEHQ
jgi:tetratricopeptide (TPR) repeat protein